MRNAILLAIAVALPLAACGREGSALAPKGWQAVPGASDEWSNGSNATLQSYGVVRRPFSGSLQDLASAATIDVLLHHHGSRLRGSSPFAPCPGAAGVATFALPGAHVLQEGFALRDGSSIRTTYVRPAAGAADPSVTDAMQSALCAPPA
ncbi:MAG TPA: hypothetical protein VHT92_08725 [Candidatus Cybelea sp.]|nr:hypothetical protein [Candidatus Cybelea sp.]